MKRLTPAEALHRFSDEILDRYGQLDCNEVTDFEGRWIAVFDEAGEWSGFEPKS